jgi:hypothetical protein
VTRRATVLILTIAFASGCLGADDVAWGDEQGGIRVGIVAESASGESAIRVLFENLGSGEATLLIGRTTGLGPVYHLTFTATGPDGKEMKLSISGPSGVAGAMNPLAIHIGSRRSESIVLPLGNLFSVTGPRREKSLDGLLGEHCSVRVSLEISQREVEWARVNHATPPGSGKFWTGTAVSGEFRRPG